MMNGSLDGRGFRRGSKGLGGIRGIEGIRGIRRRDKMRQGFHLHSMKFSLSSGSLYIPEF
jgi:hypothetical protein